MADGGTIRNLRGGRVVGKTDNLSREFADAVTRGGPPCLIVGPETEIERLRAYMPEWVEYVVEPDTPHGIVYAFAITRDEWNDDRG